MQNRAIGNLFVGSNRIEDIAVTLTKIERGDIKLRVRALDAERALGRVTVGSQPLFIDHARRESTAASGLAQLLQFISYTILSICLMPLLLTLC